MCDKSGRMNTNQPSYSASFTAGSLLFKETSCLLPLLLSENQKSLIRDEIKNNNVLKINSESSRKRVVLEITKRISFVKIDFWQFYAERDVHEQKLLLFYICLKAYKLMLDFHFNVTVKRWNSSSQQIDPYFYRMELDEIAAKDKKVNAWSDVTKSKLIGVYLRILKDIGMLDSKNNRLSPVEAGNDFWRYFVINNENWFLDACLLSVRQKQSIMKQL